jgi:hypothetical protein
MDFEANVIAIQVGQGFIRFSTDSMIKPQVDVPTAQIQSALSRLGA